MIADRMLVTTCPDCATTFKLTVALLEKAGGQVRCGRCATIFDANLSLREQEEAATVRIEPGATPPAEVTEFSVETGTGSRWIFRDRPPDPVEAAAEFTTAAAASATAAATAAPESAAASSQEVDSAAAPADDLSVDPDRDVIASPLAGPDAGPNAGPEQTPASPDLAEAQAPAPSDAAETGNTDSGASPEAVPEAPDWLPPLVAARPRRTGLWASGAVVLLLALAAQIIHVTRHDLAALPHVGQALRAVYARLGVELMPPIDLTQYNSVDLTAVAEPITAEHGWLVIETRVQNKGPKVQPFPHIFVGLLDRWQETIAGRYFAPDEYTVTQVDDFSQMRVGSTVDAQFIIVDPGPGATGFVLEFCAPHSSGFVCETE